jgi:mono/diheme cytochrome c family protein
MSRRQGTLLCIALLACSPREDESGVTYERMIDQPRYDVYEESRFFPDGKVLQHPPEGTVPVNAVTEGDGTPVTRDLLLVGEARFRIFCAACHGVGGHGGSIVAMNMQPPRPPSLHGAAARAMTGRQLYELITHGGQRMPSYAAELPVPERWAVVAYVQRLQREPLATAEAREDSARGVLVRRRDSIVIADSVRRADSLARARSQSH